MLRIQDMIKGWMSLSCSGRYRFPPPQRWTSSKAREDLPGCVSPQSVLFPYTQIRSSAVADEFNLRNFLVLSQYTLAQKAALCTPVKSGSCSQKYEKSSAFLLELKEFLLDRHSAMVLLEFGFLVWGKDTSIQCLEFRRPWKPQYLASTSIKCSKKEVAQKRAGGY